MNHKTYSAILVDDETLSLDNIYQLITAYCPIIEVVAQSRSIDDAFEKIERLQPDIVFLDVDMPPYTGFDLIRRYEEIPFDFIFVTAYDFYAIDAIKFSASYYILKPIKIDELQFAIKKVINNLAKKNQSKSNYFKNIDLNSNQLNKLLISSSKSSEMISILDINYIQADESYSIIVLKNGKKHLCSQRNIKKYEEMLADKGFFRSHKSYLVNLNEIESINKIDGTELILKNQVSIPLAFRRKNIFFKLFNLN